MRGSHSFTGQPQTNYSCLYSPAARHHRHLAGTHCAYPRTDGQAELTWVAGHIPKYMSHKENCTRIGSPSTNRARLSKELSCHTKQVITDRWTDGQLDARLENIMPNASAAYSTLSMFLNVNSRLIFLTLPILPSHVSSLHLQITF